MTRYYVSPVFFLVISTTILAHSILTAVWSSESSRLLACLPKCQDKYSSEKSDIPIQYYSPPAETFARSLLERSLEDARSTGTSCFDCPIEQARMRPPNQVTVWTGTRKPSYNLGRSFSALLYNIVVQFAQLPFGMSLRGIFVLIYMPLT